MLCQFWRSFVLGPTLSRTVRAVTRCRATSDSRLQGILTMSTTNKTDKTALESTVLSVDDWESKYWQAGFTKFNKNHIHRLLEKHVDRLLCGKKNVKIFFPLCGKTMDMHWLWSQGHTIVGLEAVDQPILEFFEESNLPFTSEPVEKVKGHVFKSSDGRIHIYKCDLFNFNREVEGLFEAIWDRGSLVAVNKADRGRYADLMKSLMYPGARCHVVLSDYDPSLHPGPPHYIPAGQLIDLYGEECSVTNIDQVDDMSDRWREKGMTYYNETLHEIIKK